MNLFEQLNKMRKLSGLKESITPDQSSSQQLSPEEQQIVDDILSGGLNEDAGSIMNKVKQYAQKGLLTAGILAALMASPKLADAQKAQIQSLAGKTQTSQVNNQASNQVRKLSPQEMEQWNLFLDFVKQKGYAGSPELDVKDKNLGSQLFAQFKQTNPNITIDYSIVPSVQHEMNVFKQTARDFAKRRNEPGADNLYKDNSPVDGWFGSKTSTERFVPMYLNQNGKTTDLGLMNGRGQVTKDLHGNPIPADVQIEKDTQTGKRFYQDNHTGDIVYID